MEIANSPLVHKQKGHKNKRSNSPDLRPNNEPHNNPVELPRNQSQKERTALIDDSTTTFHCLPSRNISQN